VVKRLELYRIIVLALAVLGAAVVGFIQPLFFTPENLMNVARQSTLLVIFALAQMVPILTRGLDLSQGGVVVATSVAFALMAGGLGTATALILALFVGLLTGALNGLLIAGIGISPLVVTLGMGSILQGIALVAANGQPISAIPANFSKPFYADLAGIPSPVIVAVLVAVTLWLALEKMLVGRRVVAVGSNERAAFLSGIPVRATLIVAYAMSGFITSIGSVLLSARISSGHPTAGSDTALQAIAAAVIGGVSLYGGRGSVPGVVTGAVFLALVANALNLLNVSSFLQLVAVGVIIIIAVIADRFRHGPKTHIGQPI
jgi:ribose transport system permease protein